MAGQRQGTEGGIDWPAGLCEARPLWWPNPHLLPASRALARSAIVAADLERAACDWARFAPLLRQLFPEQDSAEGEALSPLLPLPGMEQALGLDGGRLMAKCDHALPTTGSIKARGGVYEVLSHAETLARAAGLIDEASDLSDLAGPAARALFGEHTLITGSTGNLGFSIGLAGRRLGFAVRVHMSRDAKAWKKDRLRALGAEVIEHEDDYSGAVAAARRDAQERPGSHFIDDEHSLALFLGYSAAARELAQQLNDLGIAVDSDHPLYVYLPCGVGGAPGGIAFGLKHIFGDAVRCIFVEPVAAPCMLVQLASGREELVGIGACGLDGRTVADGLAVGQASMLVAGVMRDLLDGIATVDDDALCRWAAQLWDTRQLRLEPSAAAGFAALAAHGAAIEAAQQGTPTRIVWTTGGIFLPEAEFDAVLTRGRAAAPETIPEFNPEAASGVTP